MCRSRTTPSSCCDDGLVPPRARARCSVSWGAPARARRRSPGCCSGSTTSPAGAVRLGGVDIRRAAPRRPCAAASRSSPRTCSSSPARCATTSRSSTPSVRDGRAPFTCSHALGLDRWLDELPDGFDTVSARLVVGSRPASRSCRARPGVPDGPRPRRPRRGVVTPRPAHRAAARARDRRSCSRAAPAIVIAHRLSTVERADSIMILDCGPRRRVRSSVDAPAPPIPDSRLLRSSCALAARREVLAMRATVPPRSSGSPAGVLSWPEHRHSASSSCSACCLWPLRLGRRRRSSTPLARRREPSSVLDGAGRCSSPCS